MNVNLKHLIKRRQKAFSVGEEYLYKLLGILTAKEKKCRMQNLQHIKPRDWWREVIGSFVARLNQREETFGRF